MIHAVDQYFPYFALLVACSFAVVTDIRSRKIPNAIPIALVACALAYQACHGIMSLLGALAAVFAVLVIGSFAFQFRWIGGGDIKLLAAGCAFFPAQESMYFLLFTAIGGGFLAVGTATAAGQLKTTLASSFMIFHGTVVEPQTHVAPTTKLKMPYAIAIAFGAVALTIMHTTYFAGLRIL